MKKFLFIISIIASLSFSHAQVANDALTFGQQFHGGTARYMSMGGAFNALGGDFSTLSVNPAGIGIYRSNEFTFTGDLYFNNNVAKIYEPNISSSASSVEESVANFNLQNVGYVAHSKMGSSGLMSINFGIGYNRLKDYTRSYSTEVLNSSHSLTDNWARDLQNFGVINSTTGAFLAGASNLLNMERTFGDQFDEDVIHLAQSPLLDGASVDYVKDVVEEGRINEWIFSLGGNYDDVVYFGATFGIQDIRFSKEFFQTETFVNNEDDVAYVRYYNDATDLDDPLSAESTDYYSYFTEEVTQGIGINGKFGLIVRPSNTFRLGFAVHTPTINYISVDHYADIFNNTAHYDDLGNYIDPFQGDQGTTSFEDPLGYDYRTVSPYKLHASTAFILGGKLAIDIEGDMVDYSTMKIKDDNGRQSTYREANNNIKEMYKMAFNGRAGLELRVNPMFALRGGFSYYGSPYEENFTTSPSGELIDAADYSGDRFDYSAGFGYRMGDMFIDFAYIHSVQDRSAFVFDDAIDTYEFYEIDLEQKINRYMLTLGFKF